jgi:transposase
MQKSKLPNPQILTQLLQRFTQQKLANIYGVNKKTIYRKLNPSNKPKQKRGRKRKIVGKVKDLLLSFTAYRSKDNTLTQQEMANRVKEEEKVIISQQTISRFLTRKKRTYKKIHPHYQEQRIGEVKKFGEIIRHLPITQFSALDECHFYLNEAPRRGYAPKGQRTISPAPGSKGGSYSLIIWIKSKNGKGMVHWELTDQKVNTEFFYNFLEKVKSLGEEEDNLIMDNASFHRAPDRRKELGLPSIEEQLLLKNCKPLVFPARSPQLNPAEPIINNIRRNIEKSRSWTYEKLYNSIDKEMKKLDQEDLVKYFKKCLQENLIRLILGSVKTISLKNWQSLREGATKINNMNVHPEINEITSEILLIVDKVEIEYKKVGINFE